MSKAKKAIEKANKASDKNVNCVSIIIDSLKKYNDNIDKYKEQCQSFAKCDIADSQCSKDCKAANAELFNACHYATTQSKVKSNSATKSSESKLFIETCLIEAKHTRKSIIDQYMKKYTDHAKATVATYLSDSMNAKYSAFKNADKSRRLAITRKTDKIMLFADLQKTA